jgi:hypothetical protein
VPVPDALARSARGDDAQIRVRLLGPHRKPGGREACRAMGARGHAREAGNRRFRCRLLPLENSRIQCAEPKSGGQLPAWAKLRRSAG